MIPLTRMFELSNNDEYLFSWFTDVQIESSLDDNGIANNDQQNKDEDIYVDSDSSENLTNNFSSSYHMDDESNTIFHPSKNFSSLIQLDI